MRRSHDRNGIVMFGPKHFAGTLSNGSALVPCEFDLSIDDSGTIHVGFQKIEYNKDSSFVRSNWESEGTPTRFQLVATTTDDYSLSSDDFILTRNALNVNDEAATMQLDGSFGEARLAWKLKEVTTKPLLQFLIRGADGFRSLSAGTSLGEVTYAAESAPKDRSNISGELSIRGSGVGDIDVWRANAMALLRRILKLMSFATGTFLRAPVVQFYANYDADLSAYNLAEGHTPFLPTIHFLDRDAFFQRAVQVCDHEPGLVDRIDGAIEWYAMSADYNEVRLFTRMTALESLLWSYYGSRLSRLSFAQRLARLVTDLQISRVDISDDDIRNVVKARNYIVHRGDYYASRNPGQPDLWDHISLAHELLNRFILSSIGFSGRYWSCIGELHMRDFPSCQRL